MVGTASWNLISAAAKLLKGCDGDDGAGLFSVIRKSAVSNEVDDLSVVVVDNASHGVLYSSDELGNIANPS